MVVLRMFFLAICAMACLAGGCSTSSTDPTDDTIDGISLTIDGEPYTFDRAEMDVRKNSSILSINATISGKWVLSFIIIPSGNGTYSLVPASENFIGSALLTKIRGESNLPETFSEGTITITKLTNNEFQATFSGKTASFSITNGKINVQY
jgi:hypothetical protein